MNYVVRKLQQLLNLKKNMSIQVFLGQFFISNFPMMIIHLISSLNRPEKTKPCEKCEEFEKILDTERKSNAQLKRLIEQKENPKQQSTTNSGPCTKCSDYKKLLDIEKQTNLHFVEQLKLEKNQTEEERSAKEVLSTENKFLFSNSLDA